MAPESGAGRVVTGTFQTWTQDLRELRMEGLAQPVRVTGGHRFQVEAGSAWVAVDALRPGDRIRTLDGTGRRVAGVAAVPGRHQVFNLEVEGVHQYHVSPAGLLTHNNDCGGSAQDVVQQAKDEVAAAVPARTPELFEVGNASDLRNATTNSALKGTGATQVNHFPGWRSRTERKRRAKSLDQRALHGLYAFRDLRS